ncbi:YjbF family lipoprotein [Pseudotabrizicola sp. 4114]|uniref:YjbF family lipoprotein n=1 Tax=Pseudotabrizicola sp. 4114 TaxID=2817731 RepID=UPI0032B83FB9
MALLLAACSSADRGTEGQGVVLARLVKDQVVQRRAAAAAAPNTAVLLTRAQLAGIDDSLIRARVENTNQFTLLYVAQTNGPSQIWYSPDKASITMRSGLVTQTHGLGADVYSVSAPQMLNVLEGRGAPGPSKRTHRLMDGGNSLSLVTYDCTISDLGAESLVVLERKFTARHFREVCANESDRFTNDYWRDASGVMRASRQRVSAEFGYIFTERLID